MSSNIEKRRGNNYKRRVSRGGTSYINNAETNPEHKQKERLSLKTNKLEKDEIGDVNILAYYKDEEKEETIMSDPVETTDNIINNHSAETSHNTSNSMYLDDFYNQNENINDNVQLDGDLNTGNFGEEEEQVEMDIMEFLATPAKKTPVKLHPPATPTSSKKNNTIASTPQKTSNTPQKSATTPQKNLANTPQKSTANTPQRQSTATTTTTPSKSTTSTPSKNNTSTGSSGPNTPMSNGANGTNVTVATTPSSSRKVRDCCNTDEVVPSTPKSTSKSKQQQQTSVASTPKALRSAIKKPVAEYPKSPDSKNTATDNDPIPFQLKNVSWSTTNEVELFDKEDEAAKLAEERSRLAQEEERERARQTEEAEKLKRQQRLLDERREAAEQLELQKKMREELEAERERQARELLEQTKREEMERLESEAERLRLEKEARINMREKARQERERKLKQEQEEMAKMTLELNSHRDFLLKRTDPSAAMLTNNTENNAPAEEEDIIAKSMREFREKQEATDLARKKMREDIAKQLEDERTKMAEEHAKRQESDKQKRLLASSEKKAKARDLELEREREKIAFEQQLAKEKEKLLQEIKQKERELEEQKQHERLEREVIQKQLAEEREKLTKQQQAMNVKPMSPSATKVKPAASKLSTSIDFTSYMVRTAAQPATTTTSSLFGNSSVLGRDEREKINRERRLALENERRSKTMVEIEATKKIEEEKKREMIKILDRYNEKEQSLIETSRKMKAEREMRRRKEREEAISRANREKQRLELEQKEMQRRLKSTMSTLITNNSNNTTVFNIGIPSTPIMLTPIQRLQTPVISNSAARHLYSHNKNNASHMMTNNRAAGNNESFSIFNTPSFIASSTPAKTMSTLGMVEPEEEKRRRLAMLFDNKFVPMRTPSQRTRPSTATPFSTSKPITATIAPVTSSYHWNMLTDVKFELPEFSPPKSLQFDLPLPSTLNLHYDKDAEEDPDRDINEEAENDPTTASSMSPASSSSSTTITLTDLAKSVGAKTPRSSVSQQKRREQQLQMTGRKSPGVYTSQEGSSYGYPNEEAYADSDNEERSIVRLTDSISYADYEHEEEDAEHSLNDSDLFKSLMNVDHKPVTKSTTTAKSKSKSSIKTITTTTTTNKLTNDHLYSSSNGSSPLSTSVMSTGFHSEEEENEHEQTPAKKPINKKRKNTTTTTTTTNKNNLKKNRQQHVEEDDEVDEEVQPTKRFTKKTKNTK